MFHFGKRPACKSASKRSLAHTHNIADLLAWTFISNARKKLFHAVTLSWCSASYRNIQREIPSSSEDQHIAVKAWHLLNVSASGFAQG